MAVIYAPASVIVSKSSYSVVFVMRVLNYSLLPEIYFYFFRSVLPRNDDHGGMAYVLAFRHCNLYAENYQVFGWYLSVVTFS